MDEKDKILQVTPEEAKAEEEAQAEVQEDELREKLASDFGIDPNDEKQKEFLEKLIDREKSHREKLSGAIKQKISWREKFKTTSKKPEGEPGKKTEKETPNIDELVDRKLNERLEARDLESLGLPDELKTEVKDLAKLKGISVREAANLPYIVSRKAEIERVKRIEAATPKRSGSGSYTPSYDPSKPLNPSDFNMNTEEGRKAWKEAKEARSKYRAQHKS
jgi:hypothetical protein